MTENKNKDGDKHITKSAQSIGYWQLFMIFVKAGCAFGGGLGILAVLEDELVTRRQALSKEEFLATYALGRVVPSGTMTALAVAYGFQFGGWFGTVLALTGLILPAFGLTIGLTIAYSFLKNSEFIQLLPVTVLPAALAFIVVAAIRLGKDVFRPSLDFVLAAAAFGGAFFFNFNPAILLVLGGVTGIFIFGRENKENKVEPKQEGTAK